MLDKEKKSEICTNEDISIVMAVYNHEATVAEALDSALMQEMPYTSVIYCLNDASTDGSAKILAKYQSKYPDKIKVYTSQENQGLGKKSILHNQPAVNGRYWCLLAGDDYWITKDKLNKQIRFLDAEKKYDGCSTHTVIKNELTNEESIIKPCRSSWNLLDQVLLKNKYCFYVHPSSIVWRNIYKKGHSFFPPDFESEYASGDVVLAHMMLGKGGLMKNLPEVTSCYRVTGRGVWSSLSVEEQTKANDKLQTNLKKATSIKVRFYLWIHRHECLPKWVKKLFLSPINE